MSDDGSDGTAPPVGVQTSPLDAGIAVDSWAGLQDRRADIIAAVQRFVAAARAPSTRRAYERILWDYAQWTLHERLTWSHHDTVAAYLATRADAGRSPSTIEQDLAALCRWFEHQALPAPRKAPLVAEVVAGVRRLKGVAPRQVAPLLPEDLEAVVAALPDGLAGARDRALLLLGFAGAFRRSELAALQVEDLERAPGGLRVTIRRSKTDQEAAGAVIGIPYGARPETCPVVAVDVWQNEARISRGALFRYVTRHGYVGDDALNPGSIARIVKRAAAAAGIDSETVSGHSLRAGFVTAACAARRRLEDIMRQTRHRKLETLLEYVRKGGVFEDNAADGLL